MALPTSIAPIETVSAALGRDLAWLDRVLAKAVATLQASRPADLPGVYIAEAEVEALLALPPLAANDAAQPIEAWQSETFADLRRRCRLFPFDEATLLLALAPALDRRYGRLYAYLQDDLTQPYATPGLALELFGGTFATRLRLRSRFAAEAPLRALGLLRLAGDETASLLRRPLSLDEAVIDGLLSAHPAVAQPARALVLPEAALDAVGRIAELWRDAEPPQRPVVLLAGEDGSGRRLVAATLAHAVETPIFLSKAPWPIADLREAVLHGGSLCLADADALFEPEGAASLARLEAGLRQCDVGVVVCLSGEGAAPTSLAGRDTLLLRLTAAGSEERRRVWLQETSHAGIDLTDEQAQLLATTYRLSGGRIAAAVAHAARRDGTDATPLERLAPAAKAIASARLGRLGQEVPPRFHWDDIVLPPAVEATLHEIIARVRYQPLVFGAWGFNARHARAASLSALFTGPSGTGKTMAAEVIAAELGLSLYRVDLSAVVSKYIGETEKNLAQVFSDAAAASAVLFFDEADALFGKRSEVRDSHDRYANIEVSYLLQRLEDYDGIVVLASNLGQNLDEAFVRRLDLTADFPFPDAAARLAIWQRTLPAALPLADDVDLPTLATRYRLSGGNIRNVCVTGAFLAAARGERVAMTHLLQAIRREHQKLGKLLLEPEEASA